VKRNIISVVLALLIGLPLGAMATILLTPLLWDLEPVLHMELAGHSGPSDWVFEVVWLVMVPLLFVIFRWVLREPANGKES
jgi:ABC-type antimicrobial peptide transport system permease subunit